MKTVQRSGDIVKEADQAPLGVTASTTNEALWDGEETARFLNTSKKFLDTGRCNGEGPPFIRLSARCIRYAPEVVRAWAAQRVRTSTSQSEK